MQNIFKAMVVYETDNKTFKREITQKKLSELPKGDILIQVRYSSLNYKDALSATGNKGVTQHYPHTPGIDAAGVVVESKDQHFKLGDEVIVTGYDLGQNTSGGFGQFIRVPASWIIRLPNNLSLKESMIYGTAGLTAAMSIYKLQFNGVTQDRGDMLVTGATGGVGSLAVSILSKLGYQVVAATGKTDQKDFLMKLGAKEVIDRNEVNDLSGSTLGKRRWAGVVDTVGGTILATAIKTTKDGGSVTCCGMITSTELNMSIFPFILRGVNLLGIASADYKLSQKAELWEKMAGSWKIAFFDMLSTECTLEELNDLINVILDGKSKGRVVVKLDD